MARQTRVSSRRRGHRTSCFALEISIRRDNQKSTRSPPRSKGQGLIERSGKCVDEDLRTGIDRTPHLSWKAPWARVRSYLRGNEIAPAFLGHGLL